MGLGPDPHKNGFPSALGIDFSSISLVIYPVYPFQLEDPLLLMRIFIEN